MESERQREENRGDGRRMCILFLASGFLLLAVQPGAEFVASLLLVAMPFVTSSVLAPSSMARSP